MSLLGSSGSTAAVMKMWKQTVEHLTTAANVVMELNWNHLYWVCLYEQDGGLREHVSCELNPVWHTGLLTWRCKSMWRGAECSQEGEVLASPSGAFTAALKSTPSPLDSTCALQHSAALLAFIAGAATFSLCSLCTAQQHAGQQYTEIFILF